MSTHKQETILIPLLDEGTNVFRPTMGEMLSEMVFRVLPSENYDPEDEHWAFPPGNIVRCKKNILGGREVLIAIEEIKDKD